MKIDIAIVDDQYHLIEALRESLNLFEEVNVVFTASNGQDCIDKLNSSLPEPDLILMDIEMDVMNGIQATKTITTQFPNIKILMLSVFNDDNNIFESIIAGAQGYLLKGEKPTKIISSIEEALEGRLPVSPEIAQKTLNLIRNGIQNPKNNLSPQDFNLSKRETEILEELANRLNYQEIAEKLFISPKTVRKHIENIYKKLEVHSKLEAVQLALKNQWF